MWWFVMWAGQNTGCKFIYSIQFKSILNYTAKLEFYQILIRENALLNFKC